MNSKLTSNIILFISFMLFITTVFCDNKNINLVAQAEENKEAINIYSPTNLNQNEWYGNQNATFSWETPEEIIGASWEFDSTPFTSPDTTSEGIFYSKTYENVGSGIWYFHLRVEHEETGWTETSHFKIQIDREDPEDFDILVDNQGDLTVPSPSLYFESQDKLSGIKYYEVKINDREILTINPQKTNPYVLPTLSPGIYNISISAVDNTGNKKESFTKIEIKAIPAPEILLYSETYNAGEELLYVGGKTLPNSIVIIYLKKYGELIKTWETTSDEKGSWSFYTDELFASDSYVISATTKDSRGAVSDYSNDYETEIFLNGFSFGSFIIDFGSLIYTLFVLITILLIILVFSYCKIRKERKILTKETIEAELILKDSFKELRRSLGKKIEYLDSKPGLNPQEKKIKEEIFNILKKSEKMVEKEIRDIEDTIK